MADNDISSSSSSSGGHVAAQTIVGGWFWQAAEGHNYRWSKAVRSITRYYESAPLEGDILKLVVEYLRTMTGVTSFELNHKLYQPGGTWAAKDVWFQTVPGDKWEGTQSTKVRIYQTLICQADGSADGPYTVENGCRYLVKHTFYWDVSEIPSVPAGTSGVSYTLQGVSRDRETGLFSCVLEERTRVEQDIPLYDSVKTIFEHRQEAQYLGVKQSDVSGKGVAASASGGILVERHLSKNEDCTTNIENVITTEDSVDDSVKEWRKTLRGTSVSVTDRNQSSPLSGTGMSVGDVRRSEKTPGGLYNNTTISKTADAAGKIASMCSKSIFEHEHQVVENVVSEPDQDSACSASDGNIRTITHRQTEEGTWNVTTTNRKELSVASSVQEWRKTLRGASLSVTNRNQSSPLSGTGMSVGDVRRSEKTPGGLYNNTTVSKTIDAAGKIAAECIKYGGGVSHTHATTENVSSEPDSSCSSAGVNYQKQISIRQTEEGTWNIDRRITTWDEMSESESWSDDNFNYVHKVYYNKPSPIIPEAGDNISCSFSINNHGSFDGSYTIRNGRVESGSTLQWSFGPTDCQTNYYYFNKQGKMCHRVCRARVYKCFGKASHVASAVYGTSSGTGGQGINISAVGWYTGMSMSGTVHAHGTKYTAPSSGVAVGPEVIDDSAGS